MTENWRDIPGYEGRYMVSDQGRVRGRRVSIMRQMIERDGYAQVVLTAAKSKQKTRKVHHLVLLAFVGPKPLGLVTRHLNGIPADNRLSNLCYGTHAENFADREGHGTAPWGEKNPKAKLSSDDVAFIRSQPRVRGMGARLAKQFGVSHVQISHIIRNKSWVH